MIKYVAPYGKLSSEQDKKYYKCVQCDGIAEYRCYEVERSTIVTWFCRDCVVQHWKRVSQFIREQGLNVDLSDDPRSN